VVADIGLRLQEGIQDLKLEQQLAPAREAVARTLTVGSTNFFKAVEGVRGRWAQRSTPTVSPSPSLYGGDNNVKSSRSSTPPIEVSKADFEDIPQTAKQSDYTPRANLRPFSLTSTNSLPMSSPTSPNPTGLAAAPSPMKPLSSWGAGFGSFLSARAARFSVAPQTPTTPRQANGANPSPFPHSPLPVREQYGDPEGSPIFNGMSPETSPTTVEPQASISAVLSAAATTPGRGVVESASDQGLR
jgi:hypothetical protein